MKTVRILTSVLLAAALLALLAGCGGGGGDDDELLPEAIAYMANPDGSHEVWIMAPDGSGKLMAASEDDANAVQGSLSPNGRKLLYLQRLSDGTNIVEKDLNTGIVTVLFESNEGHDDMTPAYSPDGSKIAYRVNASANISVMNADGTGSVDLTTGGQEDIAPAWSRDGSKIVFDRGWYGSIWVMNADGSGQTQVIEQDDDYEYITPQFLPDGRIICVRDGVSMDIVVMNIDGTGVINLTPDTDDTDEFAPTVNRAGNRIAFATDRNEGQKDVYIGTFNGTAISDLTNLTEDVDYDCWRPRFGVVDPNYLAVDEPT